MHPFFASLVALLASGVLLFASPAFAQGEEAADEKAEEKKDSGEAAEPAEEAQEAAAEKPAKSSGGSGGPKSDKEARLQPSDPSLEEAPGPPGWPEGKPPGPGPEGGDAEGFEAEAEGGGEGWKPEDGVGVGCQDYVNCVCAIAELSKGKTIGGYDHKGTCKVAKTYTTPEYEELCASELDEVKDTLEDAKEDYKAHGIKLPAACQ